MIFIMINVNVNSNTKRNKKSIEPLAGDSAGLKGVNLREAIKRVGTTVYIGLGIARVISFIKDLLDQ
ncbi:hypothetical protein ACJ6YJ_20410 [Pseudomonas marginalis]|jgi:hypothetical protein|uniref:hypothetical protein n=1 Tax=Pseudomonas TaxID=286 RepID=UPI00389A7D02